LARNIPQQQFFSKTLSDIGRATVAIDAPAYFSRYMPIANSRCASGARLSGALGSIFFDVRRDAAPRR
jgi:hypothetical protein